MDFDDFGGMPADEFYLMQSVNEAEEERLRQEEEEEQLRMLEEQEYYVRQKDENLSHIVFEQERIEQNRRIGYTGGGCLISLFLLLIVPILLFCIIFA